MRLPLELHNHQKHTADIKNPDNRVQEVRSDHRGAAQLCCFIFLTATFDWTLFRAQLKTAAASAHKMRSCDAVLAEHMVFHSHSPASRKDEQWLTFTQRRHLDTEITDGRTQGWETSKEDDKCKGRRKLYMTAAEKTSRFLRSHWGGGTRELLRTTEHTHTLMEEASVREGRRAGSKVFVSFWRLLCWRAQKKWWGGMMKRSEEVEEER